MGLKIITEVACRSLTKSLPLLVLTRSENDFALLTQSCRRYRFRLTRILSNERADFYQREHHTRVAGMCFRVSRTARCPSAANAAVGICTRRTACARYQRWLKGHRRDAHLWFLSGALGG